MWGKVMWKKNKCVKNKILEIELNKKLKKKQIVEI